MLFGMHWVRRSIRQKLLGSLLFSSIQGQKSSCGKCSALPETRFWEFDVDSR